MTQATSRLGFVLPPCAYLIPLSALVAFATYRYFRTDRSGWLFCALFVGGLVLADTPWILLLAVVAVVVSSVKRRRSAVCHGDEIPDVVAARMTERPSLGIVSFHVFIGFALVAVPNAIVHGATSYASGYVSCAIKSANFLSGFSSSRVMASEILSDYVSTVADLVADSKWVFTDGFCDDGLRLELAKRGSKARLVPVIGGTASDLDRLDGLFSGEEQTAFESSPSVLLKTWLEKKSPEIEKSRFLVNPGVWRLYGRDAPAPIDIPESFAERVLHFYELGYRPESLGGDMRRKFVSLHWRLSRVFRDKAHVLDRDGDVDGAEAMIQLVDRLDRADNQMRRELERLDRMELMALCAATPREGLRFALRNLNYRLASRLARPILNDNPDDAEANFAVAMESATLGNYAVAEVHLARAIKSRPHEPALQNNMAKVLLKLDRARDALKFAEEAARLAPDSPQVRDTLRTVRDAQPAE